MTMVDGCRCMGWVGALNCGAGLSLACRPVVVVVARGMHPGGAPVRHWNAGCDKPRLYSTRIVLAPPPTIKSMLAFCTWTPRTRGGTEIKVAATTERVRPVAKQAERRNSELLTIAERWNRPAMANPADYSDGSDHAFLISTWQH